MLVASTLPVIELATDFCPVSRIVLPLAAWIAVGLHLMWLGMVLLSLWRGIAIANYGCFGVLLARPLNGQTVVENIVMLALSLWVLRQVRCQHSTGG